MSNVYGGYTNIGNATQNIIDIAGSTINGDVYGGKVGTDTTGIGNAVSNTIIIKDSDVSDSTIYGGYTYNGNVLENKVNIASSTVNFFVYGGYVDTGSATQNIVDIASSTVKGVVLGGYAREGNAASNSVHIASSTVGSVSGGYAEEGNAASNSVYIASSTISDNVYSGYTCNGNAASNSVHIASSTVGSVYGGHIRNIGSATQNIVDIASSTIKNGSVYGGYVGSGDATQNRVDISSSTINSAVLGGVFGGYVAEGSAAENRVDISNSTINGTYVSGGYVGNTGSATLNIVNIASSTVTGVVVGGCVDSGSATQNEVHIANSTVTGSVYGGYVGGNGNATDNTVEISGGSEVKGSVYGGDATGDARTGNKLIISGTGNKIGGIAKNFESVSFKLASDDDTSKSMLSVLSLDAAMDLNQVKLDTELPESGLNGEITLVDGKISAENAVYTINGTAVDGDKSLTFAQKNDSGVNVGFYKYVLSESAIKLNAESTIAAAFQQSGKDPLSTDDRKIVVTSEMANKYSRIYGAFNADGKAATNATVELSEAVSNENLTIYGGYSTGSGVDVITGNTLKVLKNGNKIKDILNFSNLDFSLDSDNSNNPTMLSLAADTVDLSKASINVNLTNALAEGQTVTLLGAAQQVSLNNDKLTINNEKLDSDLSLKIVDDSSKKYVNVADYSLNNASGKLSITANESFITSKYINGDKSKSVEKIDLTNDLSGFKNIYGSYSADNSAAEGGKLFINEAVNLSETTLIGGKSAGNGEVKNNTLEISSAAAGSKINGAEKFDNYKFVLGSDLSNGATVLSSNEQVNLANATVDAELSGMALNKGEKVVLLDNADKSDAVLKLNGNTGDRSSVAENNGTFLVVNRYGYNTDDSKIAIECKDTFAAGAFLDEKGNIVGNKTLTLGSSAASNMRAGYERASSAPDISECENIYGIYSEGDSIPSGGVVEIVSPIQFNNCKIHGGYSTKRGYWSSGNTLKVDTLNARVRAITHFEKMEFNLPSETRNGSIMLTVADSLDLEPTKKITVNASKATNNLKVGDKVRLINCEGGIKHFSKQEKIIKGLTDKISDIALERSSLNLLIKGEQQNNNTKAPVEAISATTALVNYTSELVAGKLNRNMVMAVDVSRIDAAKDNSENNSNIKTVPTKTDFATFAALSGGNLTYNTGSYVKSDSWNVGFGIGKKGMSSKNPDATYGLFFQYGKSNFSTHNDGGYRGDGDSKMFGAGLMFHQEANSKYYYQGSISAGKVDADWSCKDGSYDDKATYYSMTFGMGHKHNVGGNKTMDVYGRYSFNHVGSMEGDLNGDKYDFDSTNSHNLRFGFRMEYAKKNAATAYWGLAWEHEFAGASGATLTTPNIVERTASPSLKGDSGIAEVGYQWKRGNWEYNINAEGSFGKREGVTGSFNINYNF